LKLGDFPEALTMLELADEQRIQKSKSSLGRLFVVRDVTGSLTGNRVNDGNEEVTADLDRAC